MLSDRMDQDSLPGVPGSNISNFQGSSLASRRGGGQPASEGSSGGGALMYRPIYQSAVKSIPINFNIQNTLATLHSKSISKRNSCICYKLS